MKGTDGTPVAGASAILVPEGYSPFSPQPGTSILDSTICDAAGQFAFTVTNSGKYNLLTSGNNRYTLRKALPVNPAQQREVPDQILQEPGSLSGIVQLYGSDTHRSTVILLIGTNRRPVQKQLCSPVFYTDCPGTNAAWW